jgi:ATP-dependent helicase STH1/SNF2
LKVLKADDEEAYMKLIDTARDTRITHLLRQTDSYLDSLAQAVMASRATMAGDRVRLGRCS